MSLHLSALFEHPLKSARGNLVDSAEVRPEGLALDRRFLAHTPDGTFISGRSHPKLVLVSVKWDGEVLVLSTPGCPDLSVVPSAVTEASVAVWKDRFLAWDQGETAARWLSDFLGDGVRLAWLGESRRPLRWDRDRRVTFADAAPLLALGTSSLADLSARVGEPLSLRRFRPNLVVDGAEPFEEDTWRRLRIGGTEFLNLDGCGRCEFTTIDPETGLRHPKNEPVATLEGYRRVDTGIYFGMNLMPLGPGTLRVGDRVEVLERRQPLVFGPHRVLVEALERVAADEPGPWPAGPAPLVCTAVRDEAPGVKTYRWERTDGRPFTWRAGQYLTLGLGSDGSLFRSYTLSSAPGSAPETTVKRLEDGAGSTWLHDRVTVGTRVLGLGVAGSFTLEAHPWPSLLLLGAGSGMTPLMSLVRHVVAAALPVHLAVHQSARTRTDLLFVEELERLRETSGGRMSLAFRVTSDQGRLDHQGLVKFCPDLRDRKAFVCGPVGYRASVRDLLAGAGFKVDRRYVEEVFGETALEEPADAVPGTVTFALTDKAVSSDGRTTVLQLAERAGVALASSCRSGDCGTCRVRTSAGDWVLACRTFPEGDLTLEV